MVLVSTEIMTANQHITEMKLTVRSLTGKERANKLRADEELEGKLSDQRKFPKDVKFKHGVGIGELQTKITDQKQLVKDVKEEKKILVEMCKHRMKTQNQENEAWRIDTAASGRAAGWLSRSPDGSRPFHFSSLCRF
jgi:hypothetical protein